MNDRLTLVDLFLSSCPTWEVTTVLDGGESAILTAIGPRVGEGYIFGLGFEEDAPQEPYLFTRLEKTVADFGDRSMTIRGENYLQTWRMV